MNNPMGPPVMGDNAATDHRVPAAHTIANLEFLLRVLPPGSAVEPRASTTKKPCRLAAGGVGAGMASRTPRTPCGPCTKVREFRTRFSVTSRDRGACCWQTSFVVAFMSRNDHEIGDDPRGQGSGASQIRRATKRPPQPRRFFHDTIICHNPIGRTPRCKPDAAKPRTNGATTDLTIP